MNEKILTTILRQGLVCTTRKGFFLVLRKIRLQIDRWRLRAAPRYVNPTPEELSAIEEDLRSHGVAVECFSPHPSGFHEFVEEAWFPENYHGGRTEGVWDEKHLEHWISSELLGLSEFQTDDIYVDVAACTSPWVKSLRERLKLSAFAIDLQPASPDYSSLPYYRVENATHTSFASNSVRGASLHCAYEMFMGDDDKGLIKELARILKPGGKAVILPLYMHTHYCAYSTPEYFGKGFSDLAAKEYMRSDCYGVPSSRKYDAKEFKNRVVSPLLSSGLKYRLLALRNKEALGAKIYCHFILEIEK